MGLEDPLNYHLHMKKEILISWIFNAITGNSFGIQVVFLNKKSLTIIEKLFDPHKILVGVLFLF